MNRNYNRAFCLFEPSTGKDILTVGRIMMARQKNRKVIVVTGLRWLCDFLKQEINNCIVINHDEYINTSKIGSLFDSNIIVVDAEGISSVELASLIKRLGDHAKSNTPKLEIVFDGIDSWDDETQEMIVCSPLANVEAMFIMAHHRADKEFCNMLVKHGYTSLRTPSPHASGF